MERGNRQGDQVNERKIEENNNKGINERGKESKRMKKEASDIKEGVNRGHEVAKDGEKE